MSFPSASYGAFIDADVDSSTESKVTGSNKLMEVKMEIEKIDPSLSLGEEDLFELMKRSACDSSSFKVFEKQLKSFILTQSRAKSKSKSMDLVYVFFHYFDRERNGIVTEKKFVLGLRRMNYPKAILTKSFLEKLMKHISIHNRNYFDYDEFSIWLLKEKNSKRIYKSDAKLQRESESNMQQALQIASVLRRGVAIYLRSKRLKSNKFNESDSDSSDISDEISNISIKSDENKDWYYGWSWDDHKTHLKKLFSEMDENHTGFITTKGLLKCFKSINIPNIKLIQVELLFKLILVVTDSNIQSNSIDYLTFYNFLLPIELRSKKLKVVMTEETANENDYESSRGDLFDGNTAWQANQRAIEASQAGSMQFILLYIIRRGITKLKSTDTNFDLQNCLIQEYSNSTLSQTIQYEDGSKIVEYALSVVGFIKFLSEKLNINLTIEQNNLLLNLLDPQQTDTIHVMDVIMLFSKETNIRNWQRNEREPIATSQPQYNVYASAYQSMEEFDHQGKQNFSAGGTIKGIKDMYNESEEISYLTHAGWAMDDEDDDVKDINSYLAIKEKLMVDGTELQQQAVDLDEKPTQLQSLVATEDALPNKEEAEVSAAADVLDLENIKMEVHQGCKYVVDRSVQPPKAYSLNDDGQIGKFVGKIHRVDVASRSREVIDFYAFDSDSSSDSGDGAEEREDGANPMVELMPLEVRNLKARNRILGMKYVNVYLKFSLFPWENLFYRSLITSAASPMWSESDEKAAIRFNYPTQQAPIKLSQLQSGNKNVTTPRVVIELYKTNKKDVELILKDPKSNLLASGSILLNDLVYGDTYHEHNLDFFDSELHTEEYGRVMEIKLNGVKFKKPVYVSIRVRLHHEALSSESDFSETSDSS